MCEKCGSRDGFPGQHNADLGEGEPRAWVYYYGAGSNTARRGREAGADLESYTAAHPSPHYPCPLTLR